MSGSADRSPRDQSHRGPAGRTPEKGGSALIANTTRRDVTPSGEPVSACSYRCLAAVLIVVTVLAASCSSGGSTKHATATIATTPTSTSGPPTSGLPANPPAG